MGATATGAVLPCSGAFNAVSHQASSFRRTADDFSSLFDHLRMMLVDQPSHKPVLLNLCFVARRDDFLIVNMKSLLNSNLGRQLDVT